MCLVIIWLQKITVVTVKVFKYTTGGCIHFSSRFLFRYKWLHYWLEENICDSLFYSASQLFFFSDSLSSDNTACLRRLASKTRCTINGVIVRVDRKRVRLGSSRSPDPTRPDPKLPRFITPLLLSCPVQFCSVLLNEHLEKAGDNKSNYIWALLIQICLTAWDILHHFIIFYLKISFGLACLA